MISLIFQLTGGLLLASVFVTYPFPTLPVVGHKPSDLKVFLFSQVRGLVAVIYLMLGYFLPYLGYEFVPNEDKLLYALFGMGLLYWISMMISVFVGERLEKRARPFDAENPPSYNLFHIIFKK